MARHCEDETSEVVEGETSEVFEGETSGDC